MANDSAKSIADGIFGVGRRFAERWTKSPASDPPEMKWSDVARVFGNLAQDPERATVGEVLRSLDKMSKPEGRGQVQDIGAELVVGALRRAGLPDRGENCSTPYLQGYQDKGCTEKSVFNALLTSECRSNPCMWADITHRLWRVATFAAVAAVVLLVVLARFPRTVANYIYTALFAGALVMGIRAYVRPEIAPDDSDGPEVPQP